MGLKQVLTPQIRVNLGVIAIKGYSTFPRAPEIEPHHQVQFSVILRTLASGRRRLAPLQGIQSTSSEPRQQGVRNKNNRYLINSDRNYI